MPSQNLPGLTYLGSISKLRLDHHPVILTVAQMDYPREQADKEHSGGTSSQQRTIHWPYPESSAEQPTEVLKSANQGDNRNISTKAS